MSVLLLEKRISKFDAGVSSEDFPSIASKLQAGGRLSALHLRQALHVPAAQGVKLHPHAQDRPQGC